MTLVELNSLEEKLEAYRGYCRNAGHEIDEAGLERAVRRLPSIKTVALMSNSEMVGGYLIAPGAQGFPDWKIFVDEKTVSRIRPIIENSAEGVGIWLNPELRKTSAASQLMLGFVRDLSRTDQKYVIAFTDIKKKGLVRLWSRLASGVLYEGTLGTEDVYRISWTTPASLRWFPILYLPSLLRNLIRPLISSKLVYKERKAI